MADRSGTSVPGAPMVAPSEKPESGGAVAADHAPIVPTKEEMNRFPFRLRR